jgi:SagB-type dehydrogenase family enzyme
MDPDTNQDPEGAANEHLRYWEPHDLAFHRRSRGGFDLGPLGATLRFAGRIDPLPAIKPPMSAQRLDLPRPDIEAIARQDKPFQTILENRRSLRSGSGQTLTEARLAEFLYRTTHIQQSLNAGPVEIQRRPYPSGGALHELEFYLAIHQVESLEAVLCHYQPAHHALYRLNASAAQVHTMIESGRLATRAGQPPDVLITLAARIGRVAWKYEGMAYRIVLLNAGVVLQTMYLVATAMGLAGCAVGNGDSRLFAAAAGVGEFEEPAVAEFAIWA